MTTETDTRLEIRETIDGNPVDGTEALSIAAPLPRPRAKKSDADAAKPHCDRYLWGIYIALLVVSVIELFSASSTEVRSNNVYEPLIRHVMFLGLGLLIAIGLQSLHYKWFRKYAMPMAVLSLGLLIWSSLFGVNINGAQRAISLAGFTIQPAEIVKVTCMLLLATILSKRQMQGGVTVRGVFEAATVVLVFAALMLKDGLTNTLLLMGVSLCMFLIGGMKWRTFFIVLAIYGAGGTMLYKIHKGIAEQNTEVVDRSELRKNRITSWLTGVHPGDTITDDNRQAIYARIAQAKGGVIGPGPGNSEESARLPLAFSDYIYSIIIEDTGLVGGILLLLLYLFVLARAGAVASKCTRAFPAILIMGCAVVIVFQALVHMLIVVGVGPVSGQPLPFISKGGTSVLIMSAAMGMMLSVSRFAVRNGNKKDINNELKELPEDMQALNPTLIQK